MIKSMTGFGSAAGENEDYKVTVELKAVNQRFLEVAFHAPRQMAVFEDKMRRCIRQTAARGKVDVFINYIDKREQVASIHVDKALAQAYHASLDELSDFLHLARPDDVMQVASYPDVLQVVENTDLEGFEPLLMDTLQKALTGFDAMRQAEGENIGRDFLVHLAALEKGVAALKELAPEIVQAYRERLQKTLEELLSAQDIDETRIIQETAIYADKVNYTEEVVRLGSHFQQFRAILADADEPIGRKLDFLIQEMNRETNTIASKANSSKAAQLVVDMKSEIEKLREQVQNIE
ncbi:YicC/YloC family endoribonuclease [uncultured Mitsuokella sp.]|uniref:YicC/YloC family endoribonuclease n=1 Tax=uncultured Mitsuokella sp. TaxID=453120 RepID=UPI002670750E|nr:YicC/YloC family endoribonuclease [uncultured Mitsuokella sp.]